MKDIKSIVTKVLSEWQEDAIILEIAKTGSQINRDDPGDLDYLIICDGFGQRARKHIENIDGVTYDLMFRDVKALNAQHDFEDTGYIHEGHKLFNYCYPIRETVYGGFESGWNMLDHQEEYLAYARKRYDASVGKMKVKSNYTKQFVHYYIILKIYLNQEVKVTDAMKKDVQTLYKGGKEAMPLVDWVEETLHTL